MACLYGIGPHALGLSLIARGSLLDEREHSRATRHMGKAPWKPWLSVHSVPYQDAKHSVLVTA